MKLIIAGSRTLNPSCEGITEYLYDTMCIDNNTWHLLKEVVSGGAQGVDTSAKRFAEWSGMSYVEFPANWDKHGKAAGPIRNLEMAKYADALLLIWDGESKGSANMKMNMEKLGKPVYEVIIKIPPVKKLLYGSQ